MADRRSSPRAGSKRKFDEPPSEAGSRPSYKSVPPPLGDFELAKQRAEQIAARLCGGDDSKRSRVSSSDDHHEVAVVSNVSHGYGGHSALDERPDYQTKKLDVPNTKVGLVIGKGGETIRNLQQQSGAKIQVMRDAETDHGSSMRQIDISGTSDQISRAQQMIRDVIGDTAQGTSHGGGGGGGGGGAGGGGAGGGTDQIQIRVPNNKVGLIIGKGGETIKSLQQNSGARIQVQHDRETEAGATERIVTLSGTKQQIDNATELIKEVIGERSRGGYQQGGYRSQQSWSGYGGYNQQQQQGYQQEYGSYGWDQQQQQQQQAAPYDYYQNQSSGQQTENDGNYNYYDQSGNYYDQQQGYYQQGYDQSGYNQQGYNQEEYPGGGYNYEYDQSYSYDQSGQYPPAATEAGEKGGNGPPGDHPPAPPAQPQRTSPPTSSAQPAHT